MFVGQPTHPVSRLHPVNVNLVLRACMESEVRQAGDSWDRWVCHCSSLAWEGHMSITFQVYSLMMVVSLDPLRSF